MNAPLIWMPIMGRMDRRKDGLVFKGGKLDIPDEDQEGAQIGLFICNRTFSEGAIRVDVRFDGVSLSSCAEIVLFYDPQNRYHLNAGFTYQKLFAIRHFDTRWTVHATAGASNAIEPKRLYHLEASLRGSSVSLKCDDVEVLRVVLPFVLPQSQVGVFAVDRTNIEFTKFQVSPVKPRAFVVMQFSAPYNDVYSEDARMCRRRPSSNSRFPTIEFS
jgi:hypothetical protein